MTTQADRVTALGTPPDRVETPPPAGISHTHDLKNVPPNQIRRNDIYKSSGFYRTVSSVIPKPGGAVVVYFRSDDGKATPPVDIPEGVYAISVWRPKELGDSHV
jgi:hypothetical protein